VVDDVVANDDAVQHLGAILREPSEHFNIPLKNGFAPFLKGIGMKIAVPRVFTEVIGKGPRVVRVIRNDKTINNLCVVLQIPAPSILLCLHLLARLARNLWLNQFRQLLKRLLPAQAAGFRRDDIGDSSLGNVQFSAHAHSFE
jgi:hypothetical protein